MGGDDSPPRTGSTPTTRPAATPSPRSPTSPPPGQSGARLDHSGANHRDANVGSPCAATPAAPRIRRHRRAARVSPSSPPSGSAPTIATCPTAGTSGRPPRGLDLAERRRRPARGRRLLAGRRGDDRLHARRRRLGRRPSTPSGPPRSRRPRAGSARSRARPGLATTCRDLADSCDDYATQVDTTRETIKGLLRDLLIELAATAAVSALGSLVTSGGAAAAGAAVAAARAIAAPAGSSPVLAGPQGRPRRGRGRALGRRSPRAVQASASPRPLPLGSATSRLADDRRSSRRSATLVGTAQRQGWPACSRTGPTERGTGATRTTTWGVSPGRERATSGSSPTGRLDGPRGGVGARPAARRRLGHGPPVGGGDPQPAATTT